MRLIRSMVGPARKEPMPTNETIIEIPLQKGSSQQSKTIIQNTLFEACIAAIAEMHPKFKPGEATSIGGGITNTLVKVEARSGSKPDCHLVVRIHGEVGSQFSDRDWENQCAVALADSGLAPEIYGIGGNFRLEGWLEGRRPCEARDCLQKDKMQMIGAKLCEFHQLKMNPRAKHRYDTDEFWYQLDHTLELLKACGKIDWIDVSKIEAELDFFRSIFVPGYAALDIAAREVGDFRNFMDRKGPRAKQRLAQEFLFHIGFIHFDLLGSNIMYDPEKKDVMIIDFDYVTHGPVGADIGNHFRAIVETALIDTGELNLDMFPNAMKQAYWIRAYIEKGHEMGIKGFDKYIECVDEIIETLPMFCMISCLRWLKKS
jgi:thiamine kinase-like enzyme